MPQKIPEKSQGFVGTTAVLILLFLGLLVAVYFQNQKAPAQAQKLAQPVLVKPSPTPESPWKKYTNEKYNFQLAYPKKGVIHEDQEYIEGDCGKAIKEAKNGESVVITFDNLFEMQIVPWKKTLDDYLIFRGAKNQYDFTPLLNSGAQEAVEVNGLKKGAEYAVGYPPLVYISYIYLDKGQVFLIKVPPTHENIGGCVNPNLVDPVKYAHYQKQGWDFKSSFKFSGSDI